MTPPALFLLLPALLAVVEPLPDGGAPPSAVTPDGGTVPTVAPTMTPKVAPVLAPELAPTKVVLPSGAPAPVVAPPSLSVYRVDLPSEAAITAASLGLYLVVDILVKPTLQSRIPCQEAGGNGQCDPATLSSFDRYAVGRTSKPWQDFSDVALVASLVLPALYLGLESIALPTRTPWADFAKDLLVIAESLALTAGADTVLKFAFRRPRPSRYLAEPPPGPASFDAELSLPSGHAAVVAAATTALTTTIFLRHPTSKVRFLALGAGISLSLLTAVARVESGQHFPTDVITGLAVGACSGFLVPYFHRKQARVVPGVTYNPMTQTTMLSVSGTM